MDPTHCLVGVGPLEGSALRAQLLQPMLPVLGVDEVRLVLHPLPECSHATQVPHDPQAVELLGSGGVVSGNATSAAAVAHLLEQLHDLQLDLESRCFVRRGTASRCIGRPGTAFLASTGSLAVAPAGSVSAAPLGPPLWSSGPPR